MLTFARVRGILGVTLVEWAAVFAWLYLMVVRGQEWAIVLLFVGEFAETAIVNRQLSKTRSQVEIGDPVGALPHRRKLAVTFVVATIAEVGIWVGWFYTEQWLGWALAGGALLVAMHLKHQLETASIRDTYYTTGMLARRGLLASVFEVGGAVGALLLLEANEPVLAETALLAGAALFAGLLLEHALLMVLLYREIGWRDISIPRLKPPPTKLRTRVLDAVGRRFKLFWTLVQRIGWLDRAVNRLAIVALASSMPARPNPLSTKSPYTSWSSLTNRTWSGRHLPPSVVGVPAQPDIDAVVALFHRSGEPEFCVRSTVLFAYFAQWFTDGFLRTERDAPPAGSGRKARAKARARAHKRAKSGGIRDTRRNESTHAIDLAQLYGLSDEMTNALRSMKDGKLRYQTIHGEDFPEYLCHDGKVKKRFAALMPPLSFDKMSKRERNQLFAMGTDTRNLGFVAFNVLFLREHNRIAGDLKAAHPGWDDEQLFQTARSILIVVLIKVVVEDYINHIMAGYHFDLELPTSPKTFDREPWQRPNWMAIEFNLLYRWHSLIPPRLWLGGRPLTIDQTLLSTRPLTSHGLRAFMLAASSQRAGRIGLFNTAPELLLAAEKPSIAQGRAAGLGSYNDYRERCGLRRVRHFHEISSNPAVVAGLRQLYKNRVDDIEFYVGLFAEEARPNDVLPPLMVMMVAFDAFTQVFTNPLVARQVFNEKTFSATGMKIIKDTARVSQLVARNVPNALDSDFVSFTRAGYDGR